MVKKYLVIILFLISLKAEEIINLNVNSEDVEFKFLHQFHKSYNVNDSKYYIGTSIINSNDKNSNRDNGENDKLYTIDFLLKNSIPKMRNFTIGLGIKGVSHSNGKDDFLALPLGLELFYRVDFNNFPTISIGGSYYYAPKSLAFIEGENYNEYRIEVKVGVIKNANIYFGYRNIETNYQKKDFEFNSNAYLGVIFYVR